jgi:hypothetical protein
VTGSCILAHTKVRAELTTILKLSVPPIIETGRRLRRTEVMKRQTWVCDTGCRGRGGSDETGLAGARLTQHIRSSPSSGSGGYAFRSTSS